MSQKHSSRKLSPERTLAADVRRNPRLSPVVGQVLELLGPYAAQHPNTRFRHVEEFARCRLPDGSHHRAGFVGYTSIGIVVVWKEGFMWRQRGAFVLTKTDTVSTSWDETGLTALLADGTGLRIDWLAHSPERIGAHAAFEVFKPLPR